MSDTQFPSGPWTGFFNYDAGGRRFRMDLSLSFEKARITGEGVDLIGAFVVDGRYTEGGGECTWTKSYVGAHDVGYRGFREAKGIWGTWEIPNDVHGGFHIWPVGDDPAEALAIGEEEQTPAPAPLT